MKATGIVRRIEACVIIVQKSKSSINNRFSLIIVQHNLHKYNIYINSGVISLRCFLLIFMILYFYISSSKVLKPFVFRKSYI